ARGAGTAGLEDCRQFTPGLRAAFRGRSRFRHLHLRTFQDCRHRAGPGDWRAGPALLHGAGDKLAVRQSIPISSAVGASTSESSLARPLSASLTAAPLWRREPYRILFPLGALLTWVAASAFLGATIAWTALIWSAMLSSATVSPGASK